jgi:hypothetical protein
MRRWAHESRYARGSFASDISFLVAAAGVLALSLYRCVYIVFLECRMHAWLGRLSVKEALHVRVLGPPWPRPTASLRDSVTVMLCDVLEE